MQSLAQRVAPVTGYRMIGDLAWNWSLNHDRQAQSLTALWRDGSEVAAWAWLELPDTLMLQVDPDRPGLADDVLDWAQRAAAGPLRVEVCQTETAVVAALRRRGYAAQDGAFMVRLDHGLRQLPTVPALPAGYVLRGLAGPADVERRAAVHRAAFGSSRVTAQRHALLMGTWPYRAEFDLVVQAPDGSFAAYCQGWYDEVNRIGQFEPVGTHPDHRRRGLGRAVCVAVLRAFAAAGADRAVVYCRGDADYPVPKRLYEAVGFVAGARTVNYRGPDRRAEAASWARYSAPAAGLRSVGHSRPPYQSSRSL